MVYLIDRRRLLCVVFFRSESNGTSMENGIKDETHSVSGSDKQKDGSNIASVANQTSFLSKIPSVLFSFTKNK